MAHSNIPKQQKRETMKRLETEGRWGITFGVFGVLRWVGILSGNCRFDVKLSSDAAESLESQVINSVDRCVAVALKEPEAFQVGT